MDSNIKTTIIIGAVALFVIGMLFPATCVAENMKDWFWDVGDQVACIHKLTQLGFVIDTTGVENGLYFVEFHWGGFQQ